MKIKLGSSLLWMGINGVTRLVLVFSCFAVLTRALLPEDFGKAALIISIVGIAHAVFDGAIKQFIITNSNHSYSAACAVIRSLPNLIIFRGVMAVMITILLCLPFFIEVSYIAILFALLWMSIMICASPFIAISESRFAFRNILFIEIPAYAIGYFGVAWILAVVGFGYLSIILGLLCQSLLTLAGYLYISKAKENAEDAFIIDKRIMSTVFRQMIFVRTINYSYMNVDYWLIGAFLGTQVLGLYERSFKLLNAPISLGMSILERVLLPFLFFRPLQTGNNRRMLYMCIFQFLFLSTSILVLEEAYTYASIVLPSGSWSDVLTILSILIYLAPVKVIMKLYDTYFRSQKWLKLLWVSKSASLFLLIALICGFINTNVYGISQAVVVAYCLSLIICNIAFAYKAKSSIIAYLNVIPAVTFMCYFTFFSNA